MAKKYYAVRKGRQTGVFETWAECQRQVTGFSGAEFKSFPTREEALQFAGGETSLPISDPEESSGENITEAYVDGSFCPGKPEFSYGMVILRDGKELKFSQKFEDEELALMHNVAGEIKGAEAAMQYAIDNSLEQIIIYHDYEGIAKWCTGAWKATKSGTIAYQSFYQEASKKVNVRFIKVKGHSNNKYNDMADALAKEALGIT